ncbi:MAG: lipocalin-like domain-containing protein [Clostridiales Family XIII bacterium]|nr:lipocalin-like domain-containing protein [Clostridiales Family XIII bacterium]
MLKEWLKGTWKLESFTGKDAEGQVEHIMGEGATGFLSYAHDGWVSVQIAREGRPRYDIPDVEGGSDEQTLGCARSLFAYAGRYEVDEENAIVYHNLEFSLIPNWIGSKQKRYIHQEGDDVLILTADPVRMGRSGRKQTSSLRWRRLGRE